MRRPGAWVDGVARSTGYVQRSESVVSRVRPRGPRTLPADVARPEPARHDDLLPRTSPRRAAAGQPRHAFGADRAGGVALPRRIPVRPARGAAAALVLAAAAAPGGAGAALAR